MQKEARKETKSAAEYYHEAVATRRDGWWNHRPVTPHNFSRGFELPQLLALSPDLHGDFLIVPENEMPPIPMLEPIEQ